MTWYIRLYEYTWKVIYNLKCMPIYKYRVWNRYWRLTVISEAKRSEKRNWVRWLCKCDCWNEKVVFSDELSSWKSNSCWCLRNERLKQLQFKPEIDRKKQILNNQFRNSRFKKIWTSLTLEDFKELSYWNCFYCWQEPNRTIEDRGCDSKKRKKISDEIIKINWIDRINSNWIYSKENTVSCCKNCNTAKSIMTQEEFYKWIKKVYEFNNLEQPE